MKKSYTYKNKKAEGCVSITIQAHNKANADKKLKTIMERDYDQYEYERYDLQLNTFEKLIKKYEDEMAKTFKLELAARGRHDYAEALKHSEKWNALSDLTDELKKLL